MNSQKIDCLIEISKDSNIKYKFDKCVKTMRCERILHTSMTYPGNYGHVPNTLSGDGDPIDVLLITDYKLNSGVFIHIKIIGVLLMEDESGFDEKLVCVPHSDVDPNSNYINNIDDLPKCLLDKILYFFQHYKDNEDGKYVKNIGYKNKKRAEEIYEESIDTYNRYQDILNDDFFNISDSIASEHTSIECMSQDLSMCDYDSIPLL